MDRWYLALGVLWLESRLGLWFLVIWFYSTVGYLMGNLWGIDVIEDAIVLCLCVLFDLLLHSMVG